VSDSVFAVLLILNLADSLLQFFNVRFASGWRLNPQMAKVIVEKVSRLDCAGVVGRYLGQR